jgi:hypothetical protein
MVGRVAHAKFRGSELEGINLAQKVEHILDDLFAVLPGLRRREVNVEELVESESEEDY